MDRCGSKRVPPNNAVSCVTHTTVYRVTTSWLLTWSRFCKSTINATIEKKLLFTVSLILHVHPHERLMSHAMDTTLVEARMHSRFPLLQSFWHHPARMRDTLVGKSPLSSSLFNIHASISPSTGFRYTCRFIMIHRDHEVPSVVVPYQCEHVTRDYECNCVVALDMGINQ